MSIRYRIKRCILAGSMDRDKPCEEDSRNSRVPETLKLSACEHSAVPEEIEHNDCHNEPDGQHTAAIILIGERALREPKYRQSQYRSEETCWIPEKLQDTTSGAIVRDVPPFLVTISPLVGASGLGYLRHRRCPR